MLLCFIYLNFVFADSFLGDFVKQNLFPLIMPITYDSLKLLRDDDRKIILTVVQDESDEKSAKLIKMLKSAASANREYMFAYVGVKQFDEFTETFGVGKKTSLPKMVVWDGDEEYYTVSYLSFCLCFFVFLKLSVNLNASFNSRIGLAFTFIAHRVKANFVTLKNYHTERKNNWLKLRQAC